MPRIRKKSDRTRALEERARVERIRANQGHEDFLKNFEACMKDLRLFVCGTCKEEVFSDAMRQGSCVSCYRERERGNLFSSVNNMDVGIVPPVLTGLTMVEQILIARVHAVVSVFKIRGQQRAYSGHVINFVQNIETVYNSLPNLRSLDSIVIMNRRSHVGVVQFKVRVGRVRNALAWLKANNRYYSDITIDQEALASLPVDGDVSEC